MSQESAAGEYPHSRMPESNDLQPRYLRLQGFLIDVKAHSPNPVARKQAEADLLALRDNSSVASIRKLEKRWHRGNSLH
jgi:hypothetical protein